MLEGLLTKEQGKERAVLLIVKTGLSLYTPLLEMGKEMNDLVAVVYDRQQDRQLVGEFLKGAGRIHRIGAGRSEAQLRRDLKNWKGEVLIFCADGHSISNAAACFEYLTCICEPGSSGEEQIRPCVLAEFTGAVPQALAQYFAGQLRLRWMDSWSQDEGESQALERFSKEVIQWFVKNQDSFKWNSDRPGYSTDLREGIAPFFQAGKILLEIAGKEDPSLVPVIAEGLEELLHSWELSLADEEIGEIFEKSVLDSAPEFYAAMPRKKVEDAALSELDRILLYDQKFYYISETIFQSIWKKMCGFTGEAELKEILAELGYIRIEEGRRRYYSQKIWISTKTEQTKCCRRISIYRQKVDRFGQISWEEAINIGTEDKDSLDWQRNKNGADR